jgi:hypothetical protein
MQFTVAALFLISSVVSCSHKPESVLSRKYATSETVYDCTTVDSGNKLQIIDSNDGIEITYSKENAQSYVWKDTESFPTKDSTIYFGRSDDKNMHSLYLELKHAKNGTNKHKLKGVMRDINWVFSDPIENKYKSIKNFDCLGG